VFEAYAARALGTDEFNSWDTTQVWRLVVGRCL